MKFRTVVMLAGKTATGVKVPPEVVASLGKGKRPPVRVTIGGHTYRSTVAVMGGDFLLPISAENREKAGIAAGEEIEVELTLDTEPREVTVPLDLADALERETGTRQTFDGLSYTHQREIVMGIEGAKTAETRQRRIAKALDTLRAKSS
jgi:hypothetical protein